MTNATRSRTSLDCKRFLHAVQRFRENQNEHTNTRDLDLLIKQFFAVAQVLLNKTDIQVSDRTALEKIVQELQSLSEEIHPQCVVPTPIELHVLRTQRHAQYQVVRTTKASASQRTHAPAPSPTTRSQSSYEWDLDIDDFTTLKDAKDEKLSAHAIRQRLGLLDRSMRELAQSNQPSSFQSNHQHHAAETRAREEQESLESDMVDLAKQLKERTQSINQSLVEDTKILDAVGESAESNAALLERENAVLKKQLASSIGFWTSLWLVAIVFVVFVVMYLYIKLFGRRL